MQYVANTPGGVALSAGTARTVLMILSTTRVGGPLLEVGMSFPGVTANEPVLIELCKCSLATNSVPGTNNTLVKPVQVRGSGLMLNEGRGNEPYMEALAASVATFEPTVMTPLKVWRVSPTSGLIYQLPLGREPECQPSSGAAMGLALRMTASVAVSVVAYMEFLQGAS